MSPSPNQNPTLRREDLLQRFYPGTCGENPRRLHCKKYEHDVVGARPGAAQLEPERRARYRRQDAVSFLR